MELPTIQLVDSFCREHLDYKILYLHTLSVSTYNWDILGYKDRRDLYFYFTIDRYKDCIEALNEYDACGSNWNKDIQKFAKYAPHFSGNIWWANSSYIQTLPTYEWLDTPANYVLDRRHNAEFWIGMNPKIKYKSFYTWNYSNLEGGERLLKAEYEIND